MEVKATLKVINQADCPGRRGVTDGQTYQRMIGCPEIVETDRVRLGRATYKPGTYEQLHWHPIEACYYVISGHATVRNVEGKEFEVGPGSMIYAPPGIAGAHEWEVKESLELLDIRATTETQPQDPVHGRQENHALVHRPRRPRLSRGDQFQVALLKAVNRES